MTCETFHFVVGHMILVEKFRSVRGCQYLTLIMALKARKLRHVPVARYDRGVALLTFNPSGNVTLVVKNEVGTYLDVSPRFEVAGAAARYIFFLSRSLIEVADETFHVSYDHVGSLNNLGMAGGAAKLLVPPHLFDMLGMVKNDVLKNYRRFQILPLVTAALQAACIIDLRMRFGWPFAGNKVGQGELTVPPFSSEVVRESRLVVTFDAGDFSVGGRLPRIDINLHVVTYTAEGRGLRKLESGYDKNAEADKHKGKEDNNTLLMPDGSVF